jgi:SSS family solute:Na+ symporter
LAWNDGLVPLHSLIIGGDKYTVYVGLLAFAGNVATATIANLLLAAITPARKIQPAPAS